MGVGAKIDRFSGGGGGFRSKTRQNPFCARIQLTVLIVACTSEAHTMQSVNSRDLVQHDIELKCLILQKKKSNLRKVN